MLPDLPNVRVYELPTLLNKKLQELQNQFLDLMNHRNSIGLCLLIPIIGLMRCENNIRPSAMLPLLELDEGDTRIWLNPSAILLLYSRDIWPHVLLNEGNIGSSVLLPLRYNMLLPLWYNVLLPLRNDTLLPLWNNTLVELLLGTKGRGFCMINDKVDYWHCAVNIGRNGGVSERVL